MRTRWALAWGVEAEEDEEGEGEGEGQEAVA